MKAIYISILLCSVCSFSFGQELFVMRSPKEIKPVIGEMVTLSNANNLDERAHKLVKYETPDGGQGTFLKYESPEQNTARVTKQVAPILRVVPNPNKGYFTVSISNASDTSCRLFIYNMLGIMVMSSSIIKEKISLINLNDHPSGIYFIKCISGDQVLNQRIVKQ